MKNINLQFPLFLLIHYNKLFQRDKTWRVGSTNTGSTVLNRFVCNWEFAEVVSNHFWLNFNLIEGFSVIDSNNGAYHLWKDEHVSQMCFDDFGLFIWRSFFFCLPQSLEQSHWFSLQTTRKTPASSRIHQFHQLLTKTKFFISVTCWHF